MASKNPEQIHVRLSGKHNPDLAEILQNTAVVCGRSEHDIAYVMATFFEGLANAMIQKKFIVISGFGMFGTRARFRADGFSKAYPAFSGCSVLRRQIFYGIRPSEVSVHDPISRHQEANTRLVPTKHRPAHSTVTTVATANRRRIRKQGARLGLVLPPE